MLFLSGLLGMMALGSIAIISTGSTADEDQEGPGPDIDDDMADSQTVLTDSTGFADPAYLGDLLDEMPPDSSGPPTESVASNDDMPGTSLFARMGLINAEGPSEQGYADTGLGLSDALTPNGALDGGLLDGPFEDDLTQQITKQSTLSDDSPDWLSSDDTGTIADKAATGSADAMALDLGDWHVQDAADLMDYDSTEDQLLIVYDDSDGGTDPELELRSAQGDPETTEILVDGVVVSSMASADAPSLDNIVLVGESVAEDMALLQTS